MAVMLVIWVSGARKSGRTGAGVLTHPVVTLVLSAAAKSRRRSRLPIITSTKLALHALSGETGTCQQE